MVTTDEVHGQALGAGPSTLDPDNLMIKLAGTVAGSAGRYCRSCVGSQC